MRYIYFVSGVFTRSKGRIGFYAMEVSCVKPVTSLNELNEARERMLKNPELSGVRQLVILGYQLLRTEE